MLETWVYFTLMAALLQSVRVAMQKHLSASLSPAAATWIRYLYGMPFALAYFFLIKYYFDEAWPTLTIQFIVYASLAGVCQIVATALMIYLFSLRNFVVGTTYVKTEAILIAIFGVAFFGQSISWLGWLGIIISVAGVILLGSIGIKEIKPSRGGYFFNYSAIVGITSGAFFAATALFVREASLSLQLDNALFSAASTLVFMVILQALINAFYILLVEPEQILITFKSWRPAMFVGITSLLGSAGWFTAMTLQMPAYVKALGQVEFVYSMLLSVFLFKEIPKRIEFFSIILIVMGVIVLLLLA